MLIIFMTFFLCNDIVDVCIQSKILDIVLPPETEESKKQQGAVPISGY